MASFTLVRNLLELERDKGLKRLLLALYCARDDNSAAGEDSGRKYIALSEQTRPSKEAEWIPSRKGITVRRGEIEQLISALKSADFDAKPDGKGLSDQEYAKLHCDW
jgi:hypothetical protein